MATVPCHAAAGRQGRLVPLVVRVVCAPESEALPAAPDSELQEHTTLLLHPHHPAAAHPHNHHRHRQPRHQVPVRRLPATAERRPDCNQQRLLVLLVLLVEPLEVLLVELALPLVQVVDSLII